MPIVLFKEIIGGTLGEVIRKNKDFENRMNTTIQTTKQNVQNDANTVKLETLIHIKKLGFGQFGSVYLVKSPETGKLYALKCVTKAQILAQSLEKHLIQEKNVLEMIQHPFLMQFIRSFKDERFIYFLVEYIKGIELFDAIREIGLLNSDESQFYICQLILAIEHLHSKNIIYRDLKPENVMILETGFLKLIDMGTAKIMKTKTTKTFTIIGTPHYMAPEVITGKGYTLSVDLWSIGICLFEFTCGMVPFGEEAEDPYEIYEDIIKKDIKFPAFLKDRKLRSFIEQLCSKIPEQRMGSSFAALKANTWFTRYDWDKLYEKDVEVPWKPSLQKLLSDSEIEKSVKKAKLVMAEIKTDIPEEKKQSKRKGNVDADWDRDF
eukprot:TRINITY_DN5486_c0_g1_i7.p1 TRINITY_DN5486_c0_g1~~TRINITY_DN5486_c0_g1_i7.p1  ORF type:complete len:378 (+),score=108.91 TRINITY_DN5486_c0_g1_i7:200-1333(+)